MGGTHLALFRGSLLFGLGTRLALFRGSLLIVGGHHPYLTLQKCCACHANQCCETQARARVNARGSEPAPNALRDRSEPAPTRRCDQSNLRASKGTETRRGLHFSIISVSPPHMHAGLLLLIPLLSPVSERQLSLILT